MLDLNVQKIYSKCVQEVAQFLCKKKNSSAFSEALYILLPLK